MCCLLGENFITQEMNNKERDEKQYLKLFSDLYMYTMGLTGTLTHKMIKMKTSLQLKVWLHSRVLAYDPQGSGFEPQNPVPQLLHTQKNELDDKQQLG